MNSVTRAKIKEIKTCIQNVYCALESHQNSVSFTGSEKDCRCTRDLGQCNVACQTRLQKVQFGVIDTGSIHIGNAD